VGTDLTDLAYIFFVIAATVVGGVIGFASHFARANLSRPEKLIDDDDLLSDLLNGAMGPRDYMFEKHVVGAEWDEGGFWDELSNRNLVYLVLSGLSVPAMLGIILWPQRAPVVALACSGLNHIGLHSPFCS
jgi:hypothetical protein